MKLSKLVWILAAVLAVSLPLALAQGAAVPGRSWIYYFGINAAVIALVLFILQSFLIPGKAEKEKNATWLIVIAGSLLIAWLYGTQGYIWKAGPISSILEYHVLGNALIIGALLYFLSGFVLKDKLKSTEGNVGLGILIFVVAVFLALKIGPQWMWSQPSLKQFFDYWFGSTGILNPKGPEYRLFVFISAFTLIAFFFNNYLIKEGAGSKAVNWMLALILAANMASSGVSIASVIKLGEIIFLIIIAEALEKGHVKTPWNWVVSAILVGWASYAITGGTKYQGLFSWIFGSALPAVGWGIWELIKFSFLIGIGIMVYVGIKKLLSSIGGTA